MLAGPLLARKVEAAGGVYSLAYGDQPALIAEIVDWARAAGFDVISAGKGTKYLPEYHASTPDTVWSHYGQNLTPDEAAAAGLNSQMFNSFLDGTKSSIEMAAVANATGLTPAPDGLKFPPCGTQDLTHVLRPESEGGVLDHKGQVEVISSSERDSREVVNDLRWGVFATLEAPDDYVRGVFAQYGLTESADGKYAAMYKPFHLIGLELGISVANAALRGESTGSPDDWRGDVVATAKRPLKAGEILDGEGGYTVWGKLMPANDSLKIGGLPIGLAHNVKLKRDIPEGRQIGWADVEIDETTETYRIRREMEDHFTQFQPLISAPLRKHYLAEIADDLFHGRNVPIDTHRRAVQPIQSAKPHRQNRSYRPPEGRGLVTFARNRPVLRQNCSTLTDHSPIA